MSNPLIDDRLVDLILWDVVDAASLTRLERFQEHNRETFSGYLRSCRRLARDALFPSYRAMDEHGADLVEGRVKLHPEMRGLFEQLAELGVIAATRPEEFGGASLPSTIAVMAHAYLMAGNLSAYALCGLTTGAGHLIEAFGTTGPKNIS